MRWCVLLAVASLSLGAAAVVSASGRPIATPPPNVVVIVGDDIGWRDYGFLGNEIVQMPTLDRLASEGTVFPNGHLWASLCQPTHFGFLTGVHQSVDVEPIPEWPTLPRVVARSRTGRYRYRTFQGGKLWVHSPQEWGFDVGTGDLPGIRESRGNQDFGRSGWDPEVCGARGDATRPCPAMEAWPRFLDTLSTEAGDRFLAVFTPKLPHTPYDPPDAYRDAFDSEDLVGAQSDFFPMVLWFDEFVWEVLHALNERDLRRDTVIVYFVDNGYNGTVLGDSFNPLGNRGKNSLYELGFRTPVVFQGAGVLGGEVRSDVVTLGDVFLTIADLTRSSRFVSRRVRGHSLACRAAGGAPSPRSEAVTEFGEVDVNRSHGVIVRTPEWRYIRDIRNGTTELFAIDEDPDELLDLAPELLDAEMEAAFEALVDQWRLEKDTPRGPGGERAWRRPLPIGCRMPAVSPGGAVPQRERARR